MEQDQQRPAFNRTRLEKLDAAISWRRDQENAPLANVWHLETVADLADALRDLLDAQELDERLIQLLWDHVPGDNRLEIADVLEAPGNRYPGGGRRLAHVLDPERRAR